jgi:transcription elongation factor GreA
MPAPTKPVIPEFSAIEKLLLTLAKEGKTKEFLAAWEKETQDGLPITPLFYDRLAKTSQKNAAMVDTVQLAILGSIENLLKAEKWRALLRALLEIAPQYPNLPGMRKAAIEAATQLHSSNSAFGEVLEASGLKSEKVPVETAIRRLNGLLRLTPGRVYTHKSFGEGIIRTMDLRQGKVVIDFSTEKGRPFNLDGVRQFLTYQPPDSFLALRATHPEQLRNLAENDPVELVKLALQGHRGTLKQGELKALLNAGILTESQWNSWWPKSRSLLRLDPYLDMDAKAGAHSSITLRSKPRTLEEEVMDLFFASDDNPSDRFAAIELLNKAKAQTSDTLDFLTLIPRMVAEIARTSANHKNPESQILDAFLLEDLSMLAPPDSETWPPGLPKSESLVRHLTDDYQVLATIQPEKFAIRALRLAIERDGERSFQNFARAFPTMPASVGAELWSYFDKDEEHRQQFGPVLQSIIDHPLRNPDLFVWAVKRALDDVPGGHIHDHFPPATFIPELLGILEQLHIESDATGGANRDRVADAKLIVSKVRTLLAAKKFELVCRAAEKMTVDQVNRLRKQIASHKAFNDTMKTEADRQLSMTRRDADVAAQQQATVAAASRSSDIPANVPPDLRPDMDYHWTTPSGRLAKFREMEELRTVKIPANQMEIEKARAEGDLRENAGYLYAKEMQKVLSAQLAKMQRDVSTARDFPPDRVSLTHIGFGVRFTAHNITEDSKESYTVFGQFEVDAARNIVSYQAPFTQQFLGRKLNEEFTVRRVDGREVRYKVLTIEPAIETA